LLLRKRSCFLITGFATAMPAEITSRTWELNGDDKDKGGVLPYLLPSVGPEVDPGV